MNYGNLIYDKIKIYFVEQVRCGAMCWNVFVYLWCVLYYTLLFLMRPWDSLSFSVYMKIFKRHFWTCFEKSNYFCKLFGVLVLNGPSPPRHTPIPGVNVKVPFRRTIMKSNVFIIFYDSCLKNWNGTQTITSCSIRRVGRPRDPYNDIYIYIYNKQYKK